MYCKIGHIDDIEQNVEVEMQYAHYFIDKVHWPWNIRINLLKSPVIGGGGVVKKNRFFFIVQVFLKSNVISLKAQIEL